MAESRSESSRVAAFVVVTALLFAGQLLLQERAMRTALALLFPRYELLSNFVPGQWIIMEREFSSDPAAIAAEDSKSAILTDLKRAGAGGPESHMITIRGKKALLQFAREQDQVLYFINPYLAFFPLIVFIALAATFCISIFSPGDFLTGLVRNRLRRTAERMALQLRKQFESHAMGFDRLLAATGDERENIIRNSTLPEVVLLELGDYAAVYAWLNGRGHNPFTPLKFFFRYNISTAYGNVIQGLVAGGAAVLIFVIGLRGLKLIPAEEPSLILMSLSLEFILLVVLMFSFAGSAQEERLDRVVKELEAEQRDAIRQQTVEMREVITEQTGTLQSVVRSTAGGGAGGDGTSMSTDDERRILEELLGRLLREAERRRETHG
jgi:hypothetical protein